MHENSASLLAAGDIQGLLDLNRSRFGALRMEGEGGDGGSGDGGHGAGAGEGSQGGQGNQGFTQADVDRIVGERLAKQKAQFKDYDDLRTKAAEFDKLTEAQKTELQKAVERAEKAEGTVAAATQRLVQAEVKAIATGEFADPSDAHLYLGDLSPYVKSGDVDSEAIEAALKDVLKAKPHLAARTSSTDVGLGARNAGGTSPGMNDLLRQAAGRR